MSSDPIFRFAPSPNGYLHLGHAYSALFAAHWAEKLGGRFLLRIEDIDPERSKPEFTQAIFEDLKWLGINWPEPVMVQSDRMQVYQHASDSLRTMGLLYPCFCTRREVAEAASARDPDGAPVYAGTCRHLHAREVGMRLLAERPVQWRLKMDTALMRTGRLYMGSATPTPAGPLQLSEVNPMRWGDVVIERSAVPTSYHLSVVIDDAAQEVSHVTRGMDLLAATDIHLVLQTLLALKAPIYFHHPLITDDAQEKLSKSRGSAGLKDLRAEGWTPEAVRNLLGF